MSTQEIADQLVGMCREGRYQECYEQLYSPNVVSIEPEGAMIERAEGLEAMAEKGKKWNDMIEEMHGSSVGDPIVSGNHFSCTMMLDCTYKVTGRQKLEEISVFEVQDGKVVKEQFFYTMPSK